MAIHTKRILLAVFGSLGDLNPFLAIARELRARRHDVVIATLEEHRAIVEAASFRLHPVRPSWYPMHFATLGPFSRLRASFVDLMNAARGVDLIITHWIVYAGPLVAALTQTPWISVVLQPYAFFSAYEPPLLRWPAFGMPRRRSAAENSALIHSWKRMARPLGKPVQQFRRELGLPPSSNPVYDDLSPELVLALFSPLLGKPQPDWPPQTRVVGFAWYDGERSGLPPRLAKFLDEGAAPIVFTMGSHSAWEEGRFYAKSAKAARLLGRRAVLLGLRFGERLHFGHQKDVMALDFAPYSEIFPRAAAVVHHGGVGTTALALRAGRPMLVVPIEDDHPDNAARMYALGVARVIAPSNYHAASAAAELRHLLTQPAYLARAKQLSKCLREENGVAVACDAIEQHLSRSVRACKFRAAAGYHPD
jgi:rhamnosyltransferase subunit B